MSKEKRELKDAFKALKVHEPLKLSKEVKFAAPTESENPLGIQLSGRATEWHFLSIAGHLAVFAWREYAIL